MVSGLKRRFLAGVLPAFILCAATLFGFAAWAARGARDREPVDPMTALDLEFARRHQAPSLFVPTANRSPFGDARPSWTPRPGRADHTFDTPFGLVDIAALGDLRRQFPALAGLRGRGLARGRSGEVVEGFNAIRISREALAQHSLDDILADLGRRGIKAHWPMSDRAVLVEVPREAVEALAAAPEIDSALPWDPFLRVDPALGRKSYLQRSRAASDDLQLLVSYFPGTDPAEARRELESITRQVTEYSNDGLTLQTTAHFSRVAALARRPRVMMVRELPDFVLMGTEIPTMAMVGNVEENLPFQAPYHDAGIDGGGIDGNSTGVKDGQRVNDGTDVVPPQIVAVTDNGISVDSIQFSQTTTQVTDFLHPISPSHRKIHRIQEIVDNGSSCDSVLSGSGTHGNVVAGVIAGDGTTLGARVSKHIYNIRPRVDGLAMHGVARGARILFQDVALVTSCTDNDLVERGSEVSPGSLLDILNRSICPRSGGTGPLCTNLVGGGDEVHLQILPFGLPNFDLELNNPENGTYTQEASDIDAFLVNNRDFMVFAPVGNAGTDGPQRFFSAFIAEVKNRYPDLFNGTAADNDPNVQGSASPIQIAPPATAKNLVSVGSHFQDVHTAFGINQEENISNFSSKGPATYASMRTAPMIMGVGADGTGFFFSPNTVSAAVWKSKDNDNNNPVDAVLDDINFGTSYAAAEITGSAALVRDYFAQGFYPTGYRRDADRIGRLSGPLVKAMIAASANFLEQIGNDHPSQADRDVATARATYIATLGENGLPIGIIGNSEQGYGRAVLSSVLPLANWPAAKGIGSPDTIEYPAPGLIVFDELATGEPAINNTTRTSIEHTFIVDGDSTLMVGATRVVDRGQLRIAMAWADPPSGPGTAGALVNDLDLELVSPGPDNCLEAGDTKFDGTPCAAGTEVDNVLYDGNNYAGGFGLPRGQWSLGRGAGDVDRGDARNPVEAIHLTADLDGDGDGSDSQIVTGTWRVRVKRGVGGSSGGAISQLTSAQEDLDGDGRLDLAPVNEDADLDGFLDADGQPYGLVIAGPVFGIGTYQVAGQTRSFPDSVARLDKSLYGCADQVKATVVSPGTTAAVVTGATMFEIVTKAGTVVDTEMGIPFSSSGGASYAAPGVALRQGSPAAAFNGVLETAGNTSDEPYAVRFTYADTPAPAVASARISCTPGLLAWRYTLENENFTQQVAIGGGCDQDQFMDADENVSYSVTFVNGNRDHDLRDVKATLEVIPGPAAAAVQILNSPQSLGRIPGGQISAASFALHIDGAALAGVPSANRIVDMRLTLDAAVDNVQLSRQSFTFRHALNSDYETFHYSTDYPRGGREIRDFNRNLQIDRPDVTDPFVEIVLPDEDVMFDDMMIVGTQTGLITNLLGEDFDGNNVRGLTELDYIPNGILDKGILADVSQNCPTPGTLCRGTGLPGPFGFDANDGSFTAIRHPFSRPGGAPPQAWEWVRTGVCGFQTAIPDPGATGGFDNLGAGIWHTGDGNPATPDPNVSGNVACDNHLTALEAGTVLGTEFVHDILVSPIIAKVHQTLDSRNLPYAAEFQRLGFNLNFQTANDLAGLNWNVDNNIEDDSGNCLLCQEFDIVYGGVDYQVGTIKNAGAGSDPAGVGIPQRTFGPLLDPNGSVTAQGKSVDGDETGFSAFTQDTNANSDSPIPTAPPDFLPYPVPGAPTVLASDGEPWTNASDDPRGIAGPVRNIDFVLISYEGGVITPVEGPGGPTSAVTPFTVNPGLRWQIGIGFFHLEGGGNASDYGFGIDDVVFEWDERHPVDEGDFPPPYPAACDRFGGEGQPGGSPCGTLSVDPAVIYECDDTVTLTVHDPKRSGAGSVQVLAASDSDSEQHGTGRFSALHPTKTFQLDEVSPGLFVANVTLTQTISNENNLYVPTGDQSIQFYYQDPLCDGGGNGIAGQNNFDNLDGDGVAEAVDICPLDHDPAQTDSDSDGLGDICDNCPLDANNSAPTPQADSDGDGVGDACELDDIDFDGDVNEADNCKDVYNPFQTPGGPSGRGLACDMTSDRDLDGTNDRNDNCIRTSNPTQRDSDGDDIGDACDGDCFGVTVGALATGSCSRSSHVICPTNPCPSTGTCQEDPNQICTSSSPQCTCSMYCQENPTTPCSNSAPGCTCVQILQQETCELTGTIVPNGGDGDPDCSTVGDDLDVDAVPDLFDICPHNPNPPIVPGSFRQEDRDNDGIGDACDSLLMVDGDNNGIPDDVLSYGVAVSCLRLPLPSLVVKEALVRDLNGDLDPFCDTGEQCDMTIKLQNTGPMDLHNVMLFLSSADEDIGCISQGVVAVGDLAVGAEVDTSNLGGQRRPFVFTASLSAVTVGSGNPERGEFVLSLTSAEALGSRSKLSIQVLMDLDFPTGVNVVRLPPVFENFENDADADGIVEISDGRDMVENETIGYLVRTVDGAGPNDLQGIACAGYNIPPNDPNCNIETDHDMSWHIHCLPGEPCVPYMDPNPPINLSYTITPLGGAMALSGDNSLHWGRHTDGGNRLGDTTAFRELASFTTRPINLTPFPLPETDDLQMTFFHIADMMDNNEPSQLGIPPDQSVDHGDVQIRVDQNPDSAVDAWGFWERLAPFENVYDHVPYIWSYWGAAVTYCNLTPTDTGSAAPAPRGTRETMCRPQGVWSHCGNAWGIDHTYQCPGPGVRSALGREPGSGALWVQSRFSLATYLGQRVQIRWIAQGWEFDPFGAAQDYDSYGRGWDANRHDDGWWVDDIRITGAIESQATPTPDGRTPPAPTCPGAPGDRCNEAAGDGGYNASLVVRDAGNDNGVFEEGEPIDLDASGTVNVGGCVDGSTEYRFLRNGVLARDFSANPVYRDAATASATYQVLARCGGDHSCMTATGASASVTVYTGDPAVFAITVTHDRITGQTTIRFPAQPGPPPPMTGGYDLIRGERTDDGLATTASPPDTDLSPIVNLLCDAGAATPLGQDVSQVTTDSPAAHSLHYYLAGYHASGPGAKTSFGPRSDGTTRSAVITCP